MPVPGHSGCYAVVPPPVPGTLPVHSALLPLAQREVQVLCDAVQSAPNYADLLMHMLNRREAVDSSQIEGTHTQFDELLLHELEAGTPDEVTDSDAEETLICKMHRHLMSGSPRAAPGQSASAGCM